MMTRIKKALRLVSMSIIAYTVCITAQVITFNSPAPWITQRNDSIVVKAQLDTSKFSKKKIQLAVSKVENGKKVVVQTKIFKVKDITSDFALGLAKTDLIGGKNYLEIDWSIPQTAEKGLFAPIGIVKLSDSKSDVALHAVNAIGEVSAATIDGLVKDAKYTSLQNQQFTLVWNEKNLYVVVKKSAAKDWLRLAFDGKNGKNAFVAYSDKFVDYSGANDSLAAYDYERIYKDSISYNVKSWGNTITKFSNTNVTVICVPWSDLGLISFGGRMLGFSVYTVNAANDVIAALPATAQQFIPGTWSTFVLDK